MTYDLAIRYKEDNEEKEMVIKIEKEIVGKTEENLASIKEEYTGILEIPKINFKRSFDNRINIADDINENVVLLRPIEILEDKNSLIIVAGHSGNSSISYFKDLHKLEKKDVIYIYFKGFRYEYRVFKYYEEEKDGDISIEDDSDVSMLVLTTCKSKDKQLIYIAHYKEKTKM